MTLQKLHVPFYLMESRNLPQAWKSSSFIEEKDDTFVHQNAVCMKEKNMLRSGQNQTEASAKLSLCTVLETMH